MEMKNLVCNLVSPFKYYPKRNIEIFPRGIFEEGGDAGRGCVFRDPPYTFSLDMYHMFIHA